MREISNGIVRDYLREQFTRVHAGLDDVSLGLLNLYRQVSSIEARAALLHSDFAGQSMRLNRMEARIGGIEGHLELLDQPG